MLIGFRFTALLETQGEIFQIFFSFTDSAVTSCNVIMSEVIASIIYLAIDRP